MGESQGSVLRRRFRLKLPQYPPDEVLVFLIVFNLYLSLHSANSALFQFIAYIYSALGLFQIHIVAAHLKMTIVVNAFVVWSWMNQRVLTLRE